METLPLAKHSFPLGEKGRFELKKAIREVIKAKPYIKQQCATIPQLLKIAEVCDLWPMALKISHDFIVHRESKKLLRKKYKEMNSRSKKLSKHTTTSKNYFNSVVDEKPLTDSFSPNIQAFSDINKENDPCINNLKPNTDGVCCNVSLMNSSNSVIGTSNNCYSEPNNNDFFNQQNINTSTPDNNITRPHRYNKNDKNDFCSSPFNFPESFTSLDSNNGNNIKSIYCVGNSVSRVPSVGETICIEYPLNLDLFINDNSLTTASSDNNSSSPPFGTTYKSDLKFFTDYDNKQFESTNLFKNTYKCENYDFVPVQKVETSYCPIAPTHEISNNSKIEIDDSFIANDVSDKYVNRFNAANSLNTIGTNNAQLACSKVVYNAKDSYPNKLEFNGCFTSDNLQPKHEYNYDCTTPENFTNFERTFSDFKCYGNYDVFSEPESFTRSYYPHYASSSEYTSFCSCSRCLSVRNDIVRCI